MLIKPAPVRLKPGGIQRFIKDTGSPIEALGDDELGDLSSHNGRGLTFHRSVE